MKTSKISERKL